MGILPKWLSEFPKAFIDTYKEAIPENWKEFKEEVAGGVKTVLKVPAQVIATVIKPLNTPLIILGVLTLILLIFWKKIMRVL